MPSDNKKKKDLKDILSRLPSVDSLLTKLENADFFRGVTHQFRVRTVREALERVRSGILSGIGPDPKAPPLIDDVDWSSMVSKALVDLKHPSVEPVINGVGIILHTNLGRAILCPGAVEALNRAATGFVALEMDIQEGKRNHRDVHVEPALKELTGAEAATVVNNDAGAVLIALNTLAQGREVIVSRGQLVEIGGAFRVPDIMAVSGAVMREVGTTNRTHLYDYERAINENTAMLLKVHTSNYKVVGFTSAVELGEMAELGRRHGLVVMEDLGSGALMDVTQMGLKEERTVRESIAAGADVVCFSGDKLLGGPQAGIIVGREDIIRKIRLNPLARALRPDKLTFAALEATLAEYIEGAAARNLPIYQMLLASLDEIKARAEQAASRLAGLPGLDVEVKEDFSRMGSGSLPGQEFPTAVVALKPGDMTVDELAWKLRSCHPPVLGRISKDALLLDMRTVLPDQIESLARAVKQVRECV